MKILCIADEESPSLWDYYKPEKLRDIDLILSCGDLKADYLTFLVTMARGPLLYVHGNHDGGYEMRPPEGCDCIDGKLISYRGLHILGLGGCLRYRPGPHQYTDKEMARRIRRLPLRKGVDLVVTHAPVAGCGDLPDQVHEGFSSFVDLIDRCHPKYLLHGHVHKAYGATFVREQTCHGTAVINVCGTYVLEIPDPPTHLKKGFFSVTPL